MPQPVMPPPIDEQVERAAAERGERSPASSWRGACIPNVSQVRPLRRGTPLATAPALARSCMATLGTPGRRVAIIAGVRTPFARAGTALKDMTAIELGKRCVAELIQRTNLDGDLVEAIVYGTVVPSVHRAEHRARSLAAADAAARVRGVHREPRVRVGESGDHRCRRSDRARPSRRRHRRRRRVAVERADSAFADDVARSSSRCRARRARRSAAHRSARFARATSSRSRRRSPSRRPARRWASRPRRWRRSITFRARSRISSRCARIGWRRWAPRTGGSRRRSCRCTCRRRYETALTSDNGIRTDTSIEQLRALKPVFDREVRHGDGGQFVAAHRRRERRAADERRARADARLHAARVHSIVRVRRARSRRAVAHGSRARRAGRAAARRTHARATSISIEMHEAFAAQVLCNLAGIRVARVGGARRASSSRSAKSIARSST